MRVLVVEDDRSVRETLGMVLESYDYEVDLLDGGEATLRYLESQWPDVMLLDLTLIGMSGEEVYDRILKNFNAVPPTVVLSAVQHGAHRVSHMNGVRFLAKPYTLDQLIDTLRAAVSEPATLGVARSGTRHSDELIRGREPKAVQP